MQVFRLMGMPDKMIAFNELPPELLVDVDMSDESRMPRHWREFIGMMEKQIRIPPDKDPLTGTVRQYQPIVQKAPFTFVIDREVNKDKERWQEIESYVRRTAPKDFRLLDKLEDMALPMAADAHTELTLEPEEVKIIPLSTNLPTQDPLVATVSVEALPAVTGATTSTAPVTPQAGSQSDLFCVECQRDFSSKPALRMHRMKKHTEVKV